jgi:CheY-like chemotaxis protein
LRAAILEEGLRAAGHMSVVRIDDTAELLERIRVIDPDVILIDLESPSRDVLEQMFKVSRSVARPVAMFVDQSDARSDRRHQELYRRHAGVGESHRASAQWLPGLWHDGSTLHPGAFCRRWEGAVWRGPGCDHRMTERKLATS